MIRHSISLAIVLLTTVLLSVLAQGNVGDYGSINPNTYTTTTTTSQSDFVLVYRGFVFSSTGYGQEARAFIRGLRAHGVPLYLESQEDFSEVPTIPKEDNELLRSLCIKTTDLPKWADKQRKQGKYVISVFHTAPALSRAAEWADYNIGRTMWEMDTLPPKWANIINSMDEVWVPGQFNVNTFSKAGISREKLRVVGECVDEAFYTKNAIENAKPMQFSGLKMKKVNFLSVFNWNYRKGWDVLIEAFAKEFTAKDDVSLVIKTFSSWGKSTDQLREEANTMLSQRGVSRGLPNNVQFLSTGVNEQDMPQFYKTFDAFVLPTRAEGWGRTTMEAMFTGVPVITTKYSGQEEFVNSKNTYVVPHTIVTVPEEAGKEVPDFVGGKWAEPDVDALRTAMRRVYKNSKEAKKRGQKGREFLIENFSMEKVTGIMRDRLVEIVQSLKQRK